MAKGDKVPTAAKVGDFAVPRSSSDEEKMPATDAAPAANGKTKKTKAKCPLTKDEFLGAAKPLKLVIGEGDDAKTIKLYPREFKTGSFGFGCNEKADIPVGDTPVTFQLGINITAVNSKPE